MTTPPLSLEMRLLLSTHSYHASVQLPLWQAVDTEYERLFWQKPHLEVCIMAHKHTDITPQAENEVAAPPPGPPG